MVKDTPLIAIFNDSVRRKAIPRGKNPSIKLSMLGTKCPRKLFYSYNKVEEDQAFPLKNLRIVVLGDYVEMMVVEAFRKAGVVIDYVNPDGSTPQLFGKPSKQFQVSDPLLAVKLGLIDAVVVLDGQLWVVEIKSINDRGYTEDITEHAKPDHYVQGLCDLYLFNKNLAEGKYKHIPALGDFTAAVGFKVFYYNKNSSYSREFTYSLNDGDFLTLIQKIETIKRFTAEKILPPKKPDYCSTCNWNGKCEKDVLGLV